MSSFFHTWEISKKSVRTTPFQRKFAQAAEVAFAMRSWPLLLPSFSLSVFWPRRLCMRHTRWRCNAELDIVITIVQSFSLLAQAALRVPPEVALQCVAGHCYYHRSVSLSFIFWSRRACVRHPWWRTKRSWPLFSPTFFFFFLFLSFPTPSAFHPLRGISRA